MTGFVAALLSAKLPGLVVAILLLLKTLLARLEKLARDLQIQQPLEILAEYRVIPNRFVQLQAHEPAEQRS